MKFNIGDRVICIEPTISLCGFNVIRGHEYVIEDVSHCRCGPNYKLVGVELSNGTTQCFDCLTTISHYDWYLRESRFVHVDSYNNRPLKKLKKLVI